MHRDDLTELDITIDLPETNLSESSFNSTNLSQANLSRADLREANLSRANLTGAFLDGANLSKANLKEAILRKAILKGAHLHKAILFGAYLSWADLRGVDLRDANLFGAYLREANLTKANLSGANLSRTNFSWLDIRAADLSGPLKKRLISKKDIQRSKLSKANLSGADLRWTDISGADLKGANLSWANLSQADLSRADLTGSNVYATSTWDVKLDGALQSNLIISFPNASKEPVITVDNLEVAQFIYLLLNHKKLRDVLNATTERGVLLLGRFGGGGLEVLQAIAAKLQEQHYLPMIFDFERPQDRDYTETVKTLAGLSHFVIADLSGPSVPKELEATVPDYEIPFALICQADTKPFVMSIDLFKYRWVLQPAVLFSTVEDLLSKLPTRVIEPAEEMAGKIRIEKEKTLDELFSSE